MTDIPPSVTELVDVLTAMPGTVAVVLGGSRAVRLDDKESDWDLGVYYRGEIDLTALSTRHGVPARIVGACDEWLRMAHADCS